MAIGILAAESFWKSPLVVYAFSLMPGQLPIRITRVPKVSVIHTYDLQEEQVGSCLEQRIFRRAQK
jgi:hypothetical protein